MTYLHIESHMGMLKDQVRTRSYQKAIDKVVKPGNKVLDFGCGSGILSFFSERAGAAVVYAMDKSRFIRVAKAIAKHNGFKNIQFFHADHKEIELPEQVDVLLSEWMGYFVFQERMLEPLISLRDKYLAPGGVMIPQQITMHVALVKSAARWKELGFFRDRPYDVDFSVVEDWPHHQTELRNFKPEELSHQIIQVAELDMASCKKAPSLLEAQVQASESLSAYGLCGWFEAHLAKDVLLKTGPNDPQTHWKQFHFPFSKVIGIKKGDDLKIEIRHKAHPKGGPTIWNWSLSNGRDHVVMDNIVHQSWVSRPLATGQI